MAPTEKQILRVRANWSRISRMGLPLFLLTRGGLLFLWMCLCFAVFTRLAGRQRLLHESFVLLSAAPCLLILSITLALAQYMLVKMANQRIGPPMA